MWHPGWPWFETRWWIIWCIAKHITDALVQMECNLRLRLKEKVFLDY